MKRITATVPDDLDLTAILAVALDFKMERIYEDKPEKPRRTLTKVAGMSTQAAIMQHFQPAAFFSKDAARQWVQKEGFQPQSASPAISLLVRDGFLARRPDGKLGFQKALPGVALIQDRGKTAP